MNFPRILGFHTKGQLISKGLFGVIVWTNELIFNFFQFDFFLDARAEILKTISLTPKSPFEIN